MFKIDNFIETENRSVVDRGWGKGRWKMTAGGISFGDDGNLQKLENDDHCKTGNALNNTSLYALMGWNIWSVNFIPVKHFLKIKGLLGREGNGVLEGGKTADRYWWQSPPWCLDIQRCRTCSWRVGPAGDRGAHPNGKEGHTNIKRA